MASSKKKRAVEEEQPDNVAEIEEIEDVSGSNGEDSDDDMSDESENEFANQILNVELEARIPEESDYHGIRTLLQMLFNQETVNLSDMTDIILSQNYVGCVLKQITEEDDDDDDDDAMDVGDTGNEVFGVMTAINITERQGKECIKQLSSLVVSKCKSVAPANAVKVADILHDSSNQIGFLISERLYGLPAQVTVPSLKSLQKDMEKACRKNMKYEFSHYLMLCQTYQCKDEAGVTFYTNPEEELFVEMSDLQCTWKLANDDDDIASRTMVLFTADKLDAIIKKLEEMVSSST